MIEISCEYVRDVLPDMLHGNTSQTVTDAVRQHLRGCDDCREEAALLETLRLQPIALPAGLHERVVTSAAVTRRKTRTRKADLAMAATLAAAVIGGSVIVKMQGYGTRADVPAVEAKSLGAVGVEEAMLSGKASLDDLSVEQLEQLLVEIES